jgi:hypothetical protein
VWRSLPRRATARARSAASATDFPPSPRAPVPWQRVGTSTSTETRQSAAASGIVSTSPSGALAAGDGGGLAGTREEFVMRRWVPIKPRASRPAVEGCLDVVHPDLLLGPPVDSRLGRERRSHRSQVDGCHLPAPHHRHVCGRGRTCGAAVATTRGAAQPSAAGGCCPRSPAPVAAPRGCRGAGRRARGTSARRGSGGGVGGGLGMEGVRLTGGGKVRRACLGRRQGAARRDRRLSRHSP